MVTLLVSQWAIGNTFSLPAPGSNIVGNIQYHEVKQGETLASIADDFNVGFLALMAANKGVDPFLPEPGYALTIPTEIILPPYPHEGIIVNLAELRLYYFEPEKEQVHIFPVGIGRIGRDTPEMETKIVQKRPNPTWTPTQTIRNEYLSKGITLPNVVPAGKDNPLGLFALRLGFGGGEYLIHGTNKDFGIGLRVSSGCIRMNPADIEWLFNKVALGEKVRIINQPVKVSLEPDRSVIVEAHEPLTRSDGVQSALTVPQELQWWLDEYGYSSSKARAAIKAQNGVPLSVAH
jgi:L,D-transpeptidase YcfS